MNKRTIGNRMNKEFKIRNKAAKTLVEHTARMMAASVTTEAKSELNGKKYRVTVEMLEVNP